MSGQHRQGWTKVEVAQSVLSFLVTISLVAGLGVIWIQMESGFMPPTDPGISSPFNDSDMIGGPSSGPAS